jgi:hypothetical protein
MMNVTTVLLVITVLVFSGCSTEKTSPEDPPPVDPSLQAELSAWLASEGQAPDAFVMHLFADHDVVFLGEQHRVQHDVVFVQSLIQPLHKAGVLVLATEFGRREDQPMIDSLLGAPEWNEDLARKIVFRQSVFWGYREYIDVYRSAWTLNQALPDGTPPFRILGINDSPDWGLVMTVSDLHDSSVMREVWHGGGEDLWAGVILDAVRSGEKVLVHCGIHHAFTEYRQPVVHEGEFKRFDPSLRCGNHVFGELGRRSVTVYLHAPWNGPEGYGSPVRHPADGIIDALMLKEGPEPVGFITYEGPFGDLRLSNAVYRHGYEDFRLADFCDGWIYTKPISLYAGVTPIPGWVHEGNLQHAQQQSPNPRFREATAERFNQGIAWDAEIHRRWGHLR